MWHYTGYPVGDDSDSDVEGTELADTHQNMTLVKTCDDGLRGMHLQEREIPLEEVRVLGETWR